MHVQGLGSFHGVQIIPTALVGAVRAWLTSRGLDPNIVQSNGELDAGALITMGFDTMEIDTALTPNMRVNLRGPSDPETQAVLNQVRPTVVLSGPAGRYELAPYGQTAGAAGVVGSSRNNALIGLGAAAFGLWLIFQRKRSGS